MTTIALGKQGAPFDEIGFEGVMEQKVSFFFFFSVSRLRWLQHSLFVQTLKLRSAFWLCWLCWLCWLVGLGFLFF